MTARQLALFAALATGSLSACGVPAATSAPPLAGGNALAQRSAALPGSSAPAAYCAKTGGTAENGVPYYDTNAYPGTVKPLRLAGSRLFCIYTSTRKATQGTIYVFASTLYATQPTLAALAYFAKVPLSAACVRSGQPAACYCSSQLGASDFENIDNGGSWVFGPLKKQNFVEACVFPDLSSIDSWGLLFHSKGIIRGINLAKVLRYHPPSGR